MSCEICGRGACTQSFHSFEEQEEFDTKTGRYAPEEDRDCPDCQGTGIGYNHEPHSCARCKGRGYLLEEPEE